jgi:gliding motility-associated-like protein
MNRIKIKMSKKLLIVLAFLLFNIGYGQNVWLGGTSAWDIGTNWSYGQRPGNADDVLIPNVPIQPVITAGAICNNIVLSNSVLSGVTSLTVNGLGSLTVSSIEMVGVGSSSLRIGTGKVIVKGNVTMNGSAVQNDVTFSGAGNLTIGGAMTGGKLNAGTGLVNYNAITATQSVGAYTYNDLTLSGKGVKMISATGTVVSDILSMEGTATVSSPPSYDKGATLQYNSTEPHIVGPEWIQPYNCEGGIIIANTGVVTITDVDKYIGDGIPLTISAGAKLSISGGSSFYLGGNLINDGVLVSDGFVYINGEDETQNIDSFTAKGIVMSKNAGTATFTQNMISGQLIINGLGTLSLGNGSRSLTHAFTDWVRTQGTLNGGTSVLRFSGNVIGNGGDFTAGTGTVDFNGGAQNLGTGSITYNNLTLSVVGTKTFGAKTIINETISIAEGVIANLTAGLVHTAKNIKLGAANGNGGSWGSSLSNAVNKNNVFFVSNDGIINVGPTIEIDTNSLTALSSIYGSPSLPKSFTIKGLALLEGISVDAPLGFEVSTDGTNFTDTVTFGAAGDIAATKIYVRLKGTIDAKDYSGNIVLKSSGTTDVNIAIPTSTVNKAQLKITAGSKERIYGVDDQELTVAYDKFVNGDTVESFLIEVTTIKNTTTAIKSSIVGIYPIIVSGPSSSKNYIITYGADAEFKITPAELTITADEARKIHGDKNPTLTVKYSGFVNGDNENGLTFTKPVITTTAVTESAIGEYPITVAGASSSNYNIKFVDNVLNVVASNNAGLSDIDVSKGDLDPTFDTDKKGYTVEVPNDIDTYVINPIPSNPNSTVIMTVDGVIIDPTAPLDLKVGDNVITIVVTAEDGITQETYEVIVTREPSSNAGLIDLAISEGTLSPTFEEGILDYTTTVPNDITSIKVTPVSADPTAIITVNGIVVPSGTASPDQQLKVGENEITTIVTAQDGTIQTYTVIVTREEAPLSNNAGLTDLAISEGTLSPIFEEGTKDYTTTVPNDVKTISVTPVSEDATATITVNGIVVPSGTASPEQELKVGKNEIITVVTAQDGTVQTYTVIVTREEAPLSNDAALTDLAISEGTLSPAFAEGTKDYTTIVPNDITSIKVTPVIEDATATITVNGIVVPSGTASADLPLKVGENVIITTVTAQDGTVNTYTIIVTREEATAPDNAGLSDIIISDGALNPAFNTDTNDYRVDVPNETNSYIVNPIAIDPNATIEIKVDGKTIDPKSPIDLNVGDNVITVVVTAPDGTQETYIVIVNRADAVPQAIIPSNIITPNGDGKNDYWIIDGLDKYPNNSVKVFDRAARLVYSKNNYNNDWDGSYKGSPVNEDTYYYLIDLGNGSPKIKGFISIIRN